MSPAELIGSLEILDLTKTEAGEILGYTYRSVLRWSTGEQKVPPSVAIALRLAIRHGERLADWAIAD
jgi:hypothetical protein